jgi:uncharacterized membrane protein
MRDLTLYILLALQIVMAVVTSWILMIPVFPSALQYGFVVPFMVMLVTGGAIVAALVTTRRLAAGGGDFTPDACWKGGLFYYNPNDPAIFVEQRVGIGYTLNFGHRWAWLVMVLMLLPGLAVTLFTMAAN